MQKSILAFYVLYRQGRSRFLFSQNSANENTSRVQREVFFATHKAKEWHSIILLLSHRRLCHQYHTTTSDAPAAESFSQEWLSS